MTKESTLRKIDNHNKDQILRAMLKEIDASTLDAFVYALQAFTLSADFIGQHNLQDQFIDFAEDITQQYGTPNFAKWAYTATRELGKRLMEDANKKS